MFFLFIILKFNIYRMTHKKMLFQKEFTFMFNGRCKLTLVFTKYPCYLPPFPLPNHNPSAICPLFPSQIIIPPLFAPFPFPKSQSLHYLPPFPLPNHNPFAICPLFPSQIIIPPLFAPFSPPKP